MRSFLKGLVQYRIESSGSESSSTASESHNLNLMDDLVSTPHNQLVVHANFGGPDLRRTPLPNRSTPHNRVPVDLVDISDDDEDDSSSLVPIEDQQASRLIPVKFTEVPSVASRPTKRQRDDSSKAWLSRKQQKGKGIATSGLGREDLFHQFKFSSPLSEQSYMYFSRRQMIKELNLDLLADKWITDVISEAGLLNTVSRF